MHAYREENPRKNFKIVYVLRLHVKYQVVNYLYIDFKNFHALEK